jgi:hypothetical protein
VTTANSWVNDDSKTRQRVISYTLNDETKFILQQEEQSSIPITLFFNTSYQLTFNSITQYLVSFEFKGHYGVNLLPSATLQIVSNDTQIVVPKSGVWLDKNAQFYIGQIIWATADVKPKEQTSYIVTESLNKQINCQVYPATLEVKDLFNLPISAANVKITFANQTSIETLTSATGTVDLGLIPLGYFEAFISYFAESTQIVGDVSSQPNVLVRIIASPSVLIIVASVFVISVSSLLFVRRRLNIISNNATY